MVPACVLMPFILPFVCGQPSKPDPLFLVSQGGKSGYINQNGRIVIPLQFRGARDFHEGRTCVQLTSDLQSKCAVIDSDGNALTPAQFTACGEFSEGLAAVAFDTDKTPRNCMDCDPFYHWGYIDRAGRMVIKAQFHTAGRFSEGSAAVENDDGKWGFVDKSGRTVIGFQFDFASSFSDGLAVAVLNRKYVYINHAGKLGINGRFNEAQEFSDGLALVRTTGEFVPPFGMIIGTKNDQTKEFLYIDKSGRVRIRLKGEHANGFSEGLAEFRVIKRDGYLYCGYIDKTGTEVIPPKLVAATSSLKDLRVFCLMANGTTSTKPGISSLIRHMCKSARFGMGLRYSWTDLWQVLLLILATSIRLGRSYGSPSINAEVDLVQTQGGRPTCRCSRPLKSAAAER